MVKKAVLFLGAERKYQVVTLSLAGDRWGRGSQAELGIRSA